MQFRSQGDEEMSSMHQPLFSISLLFCIILSAPSTAFASVTTNYSIDTEYADTGGRSINPTAVSPSMGQSSTVTMGISTSSNQTDNITTNISPSLPHGNTTNMTSPTQESSTDTATTPLSATAVMTQTSAWTTTKHSPTNQTQPATSPISTSEPTSQSTQTTVMTTSTSIPTGTVNTTAPGKTQGPELGLSHSEASMTVFFGVVLGLTVLTLVGCSIHRCKQREQQYIHQPLYNSSETVDRFSAPDDTLVISGGLYDGPGMFNSALTPAEDMGLHSDPPLFAPQPTQFRLEFLSEDQHKPPSDCPAPTFQSFQPFDAND